MRGTLRHLDIWIAWILITTAIGCGQSSEPDREPSERIRGYITSPDGPVSTWVWVTRLDTPGVDVRATGRTDRDGWFDLPVIPGFYLLEVRGFFYGDDQLNARRADAEPILVRPGELTPPLDLKLSTVQIEVEATDPGLTSAITSGRLHPNGDEEVGISIFHDFSAPDGRWILQERLMPPGEYELRINLPNHERVSYPLEVDGVTSDMLTVLPGTVQQAKVRVPSATRVILPLQSETLSNPNSAMDLILYDSFGSSNTVGEFAENGQIQFDTYQSEPFRLRLIFRASGFPIDVWYNTLSPAFAYEIEPAPGETVTLSPVFESKLDLTLEFPERREGVRGTISIRTSSRDRVARWSVVSDDQGMYRGSVVGILPDEYGLDFDSAAPGNVINQAWSKHGDPAKPTPLLVPETAAWIPVHWKLSNGGELLGAIEDTEGNPVFAAHGIYMSRVDSDRSWYAGSVSPDGAFHIRGIYNGSHRFAARLSASEFWWYPGVRSWEEAAVVDFIDYETIDDLKIVIDR